MWLLPVGRLRRADEQNAEVRRLSDARLTAAMERQPDPKGDRVKISMSGKFLPYKYYGASGNVPTYGYKEEQVAPDARRWSVVPRALL